MTESGEESTLKGEFQHAYSGVQLCERTTTVHHTKSGDARSDNRSTNAAHAGSDGKLFRMIFVLKGQLSLLGFGEPHREIIMEDNQHNLCYIADTAVAIKSSHPNDEIICINLSHDFLNRYLPSRHPAYQQLTNHTESDNLSLLSALHLPISPEIHGILQRLGGPGKRGFCDQLLLESKVVELLAHQISQFEQLDEPERAPLLKKEELERMQKVKDIVINQSGAQLSLRSLAHLVGTNEFNLKRNFKAAFGNTVYGYLTQYKMERAKTLLTEENLTIADVSQRVGYKHPTHFTSAFKKYFGYLPNKLKGGKLFMLIFLEDFSVLFEELCLAFL